MNEDEIAAVRARNKAALDMVHALCQPRGSSGSREWIMSIPARPEHDPDLVIAAALRDIDTILTAASLADSRGKLLEVYVKECELLLAEAASWRDECAASHVFAQNQRAAVEALRAENERLKILASDIRGEQIVFEGGDCYAVGVEEVDALHAALAAGGGE